MVLKKINFKRIFYLLGLLILFGIYLGSYADITIEELKKDYADRNSKFIEINGVQVHYKDQGVGFPIVLLHGTAASLHTWNDWTNDLLQKYRVIRLDLPAFGLTGPHKTDNYSIAAYTSFLHQFMTKIEVPKFYLVGNSLGGNIAWNYAAKYPNEVEKLVLIDASGLSTNKPQPFIFKIAKTPVLNAAFLFFTPKFLIQKNLEQVYFNDHKITDTLVTRYHKLALRTGNRKAFIDRANLSFKPKDSSNIAILRGIKTPTLLIWGENDVWIPKENGKKMAHYLPNSTLVILKNTGHVPMEENPIESFQALYRFLEN